MRKKENGSGGFSYAMCFIGIVTIALVYTYTTFISNLYVVESVIENGLHLVENIVLTSNQSIVTNNNSIYERNDAYEREMQRTNIVTECIYSDSFSDAEEQQVATLGKLFQDSLIKQFNLSNNTHPSSGILKNMCGEESDIIIIGDVIIYEPVYRLDVSPPALNPDAEVEDDPKYVSKKWIFSTDYTITGWVQYNLHFTNNAYSGCSKKICSQPTLKNGNLVEGATIESTVGLSLKGLKNIFADVSTTTPTIDANGNYDLSNVEGGMFSKNPTQNIYDVTVTQAVDIVIADKDSRKR